MGERPTNEIVILIFAATLGLLLVGSAVAIAIIEIRDPDTDTTAAAAGIGGLASAVFGALFGMLIRRSNGQ